jgi:hypothetical protein
MIEACKHSPVCTVVGVGPGNGAAFVRRFANEGYRVAMIARFIDGVVDEPGAREQLADKPDDFFVKPEDIADTLIMPGKQRRSAWSFELEARPFGEAW